MIKLVPFYKDIDPTVDRHKKLKQRIGKVDYRKNLDLLYKSFNLFNPNGQFIVQSDMTTHLPYKCHRSDLSSYTLIESIIVGNLNYVKDNLGKSILVGADNIILDNVDIFFEDEFDIGLYCPGEKNKDEKFNLRNGVVLVNSSSATHSGIIDFFTQRHNIYKNFDQKYRLWWGDMLSLNVLVSQKNIIKDFYESNKTKKIFNFNGLKIKIFEINKDYYKFVDGNGNYIKGNKDVILDFPGDNSVKKHAELIFNKHLTKINNYT